MLVCGRRHGSARGTGWDRFEVVADAICAGGSIVRSRVGLWYYGPNVYMCAVPWWHRRKQGDNRVFQVPII
jgi:hypothetical protein